MENIMRKKILFLLFVIFIAYVSISSVNSSWFFDEGQDISVNGLNFHIPADFELALNYSYGDYNYKTNNVGFRNNYNEGIIIKVTNIPYNDYTLKDWLNDNKNERSVNLKDESISGKDGVVWDYYSDGQKMAGYAYVENNRIIMITCSYSFHDGAKYDNFLSEVIK